MSDIGLRPASAISIGSPFAAGLGASVEPSAPPSAEPSPAAAGFSATEFVGNRFCFRRGRRGAGLAFDGGGGGFQRIGADGEKVGIKMSALDGDGDANARQQNDNGNAGKTLGKRDTCADKLPAVAGPGFFFVRH